MWSTASELGLSLLVTQIQTSQIWQGGTASLCLRRSSVRRNQRWWEAKEHLLLRFENVKKWKKKVKKKCTTWLFYEVYYQTLLPYQWVTHFFLLYSILLIDWLIVFLSEISCQYWFWDNVTVGHDLKRYLNNVQSYSTVGIYRSYHSFCLASSTKVERQKYPFSGD